MFDKTLLSVQRQTNLKILFICICFSPTLTDFGHPVWFYQQHCYVDFFGINISFFLLRHID